jgi:hypothetical protein
LRVGLGYLHFRLGVRLDGLLLTGLLVGLRQQVIEGFFQDSAFPQSPFHDSARGFTLAETGYTGFFYYMLIGMLHAFFHFSRLHLNGQESLAIFHFLFSYFQITSR